MGNKLPVALQTIVIYLKSSDAFILNCCQLILLVHTAYGQNDFKTKYNALLQRLTTLLNVSDYC